MMERNVSKKVWKVYFFSVTQGKFHHYEGRVLSVTQNGTYLVLYDHDNDSEELKHNEFLQCSKAPAVQADEIRAAFARVATHPPSCNCSPDEPCYHPWVLHFGELMP